MKDTRGVPIDQRRSHSNKLLGSTVEFCHGVALAAGVVVFVELIAEETADFSAQFFLDIGTERIAPLCAADGIVAIRVLSNLHKLVNYLLIFRPLEMGGRSVTVYPAILADLDPLGPLARIDSRP